MRGQLILVDTSAWIEYDRATGSESDLQLDYLIRTEAAIGVTEPVVMEVVSGARTGRGEVRLRRLLASHYLIPVESTTDFDGAAKIYRSCRSAGITPSGLMDCLIATIAMRSGASVLAADREFELIASVLPLELHE